MRLIIEYLGIIQDMAVYIFCYHGKLYKIEVEPCDLITNIGGWNIMVQEANARLIFTYLIDK